MENTETGNGWVKNLVIGILVVALLLCGAYYFLKVKNQTGLGLQTGRTLDYFNDDIGVSIGGGNFLLDVKNKTFRLPPDVRYDISDMGDRSDSRELMAKFAGLPKESKTATTLTFLRGTLDSIDRTKIIVTFETLDTIEEHLIPEYMGVGSRPVLESLDYICDVDSMNCKPSTLLTDSREKAKLLSKVDYISADGWDSNKNIIYFTGYMLENNSTDSYVTNQPIFIIYHTDTKTVDLNDTANWSNYSVSPDFNKIFTINYDKTTGVPRITVYNTNDLLKPVYSDYTYDYAYITVEGQEKPMPRYSFIWSQDESKILIFNEHTSMLFDLGLGKFRNLQLDNIIEAVFSADSKYVVFTENSKIKIDASQGDFVNGYLNAFSSLKIYDLTTGATTKIISSPVIRITPYRPNYHFGLGWPEGVQ